MKADGDQIGQVVLNLLVNAQQALAGLPARRRVKAQTGVEARRDNREPRVWLRVADSGPGVSPELAARIFEPFFTTKAEGLGTGLGLAVSRSLAREHGGELILEAPGAEGGASFRLSVPVSGVAEALAADATGPADEAPTQARLLVVDDEPELLGLMREMLEGAGYDVATAESGAVALALLETARFDAIVSDLRMPDVDGATLWREVQRRQPSLARQMLFVTGDTLSPDASEFLKEARCSGLDKPSRRPICWRGWRRWWRPETSVQVEGGFLGGLERRLRRMNPVTARRRQELWRPSRYPGCNHFYREGRTAMRSLVSFRKHVPEITRSATKPKPVDFASRAVELLQLEDLPLGDIDPSSIHEESVRALVLHRCLPESLDHLRQVQHFFAQAEQGRMACLVAPAPGRVRALDGAKHREFRAGGS